MKHYSVILKNLYFQFLIVNTLFLLALFLSSFGLALIPEGSIKGINISIFLVLMVNIGVSLGKGYYQLKQTYLWNTSKTYRDTVNKIILALPIFLCFIVFLLIAQQSHYKQIVVLISLLVIYNQILTFDKGYSSIRFYTTYFPLLLLFIEIPDTWSLNKLLLLVLAFYLFTLLNSYFNYKKQPVQPKKSRRSPPFKNIKILQPNYSNKDIGYALTNTGVKFPFTGLIFSIILVLFYSWNKFIQTDELSTGTIMMMVLGLNLYLIFHIGLLIKQSQKIFHVFAGANHSGIKNELIKAMDKIILKNNLIFMVIVLSAVQLLDLHINRPLTIVLIFIPIIFIYSSYLLFIGTHQKIKGELMALTIIIYIVTFLILNSLLKYYVDSATTLPFILMVSVVAFLLRWFGHQHFMKIPFEKLVKF